MKILCALVIGIGMHAWQVKTVPTTKSRQFNEFGIWKMLDNGREFTLRSTRQVRSVSEFFTADVAIAGQPAHDQRYTP